MTTFYSYGELAAAHATGRTRVRRHWTGKLVLQIEIKHPVASYPRPPQPPGEAYNPWRAGSFTFWRDAKLSDLSMIEPPIPKGQEQPA